MPSFNITGLTTATQTLGNGETGVVTVNGTLSTAADGVTISHTALSHESNVVVIGAIVSAGAAAIALIDDGKLPTIELNLTGIKAAAIPGLAEYHAAWRIEAYASES